jgi:hypothetical protein
MPKQWPSSWAEVRARRENQRGVKDDGDVDGDWDAGGNEEVVDMAARIPPVPFPDSDSDSCLIEGLERDADGGEEAKVGAGAGSGYTSSTASKPFT